MSGTGTIKKSKMPPYLQQVNELVSKMSAEAAAISDTESDIVVHVIDQGHGVTRDFLCNKQKVMMKMRYFQHYFTATDSNRIEELDISVHCDVNIFDWLVRYL